jgi:hypothetical protein
MMTADVPAAPSEYYNYVRPIDVNNDGLESTTDLLVVLNSLTLTGPRSLTESEPAAAMAEGESSGLEGEKFYIDTNDDEILNTLDLLKVINELSAEGEDTEILANFKLVPVAMGTNTPITSIPEGGHYELRVLANDTGVLEFDGQTRPLLQPNGNDFIGLFDAFIDMNWDRAQTDLQVNETQTIVINGSPSAQTRFTLTFTDTDNTQQTTGPITFVPSNRDQTALNIRDALVALTKIGSSAVGALPNVEVVSSSTNNRTFTIRFVNDEASKNFANLSGTITVPGTPGATSITVTENVAGDPTSLVSFQEMFRPRPVLDENFEVINDDPVTDLLYYTLWVNPDNRPFALPQPDGAIRAGGSNGPSLVLGGPRPGTREVEVFRLRMTAKDKIGNDPVTFSAEYPDVSSRLTISLLGFNTAAPAHLVNFIDGTLNIIEPVSAGDDSASVNEGTSPASLNTVAIDVLANDADNTAPINPLVLLQTPILPPGFQGTVVHRTAGQDGINRPHFLYTVPNADFSGVVTFQYTIQDSVNAALTDTGTVTITVNPTNDAPVNSVPGALQTVAEDAPAGLVFGGGNAITISDVDAGAASVSIRLQSTNGTLKLPSLPGSLAITGDGTNDLLIVGSIANINPALSGLKYAPNQHFNGSAQITVTTDDNGNTGGTALTDVDTININVTATNDAPVNSVPAAVQVDEQAQFAFTNGSTISTDDLDITNKGSATPAPPGGTLTVTLSTDSTQGGTLNVTATGGATVNNNNTQNVTVSGIVNAVQATLATLKFNAGAPEVVTLTVLTSDNGNTGTPGPLTDTDTVEITVVATVRPRANPNTYNLSEGPVSFDLNSPSVLANDIPNANADVTLESVGTPSVGSVVIVDAGVIGDKRDDIIRYTPPSTDFFGQVTFTYSISETPVTASTVLGSNATATVTLNIANTPDAPVANPDGPYAASEQSVLTVTAANGVLVNDTDADNLTAPFNAGLTAQLVAQPPAGQGTVNLGSDGSFTWTPPAGANFFGTTSFTYRAVDPQSNQSNEATVTINVASVNDAPVAVNDGPGGIYVTNEDVPLVISLPNSVLSNDTDVETQNLLTAILVPNSATNGTVSLNADGTFTFTPNEHFNSSLGQGVASFQYRAFDNDPVDPPQVSNIATVTIQVNAVNDEPVANAGEYTVEEGAVLSPTVAQGLRSFVTDPDQPTGFTGSIALVPGSGPAQGTLVLNPDGSFTYTPPPTVVDPFDVTFRYTASDGQATSNEGTITIHVIEFNDPPVAVADGPYPATEDQTLNVSAANGVIPNDSDEETPDSGLTAILVTNVPAAAGSVVLNADGSFSYTPAPHFFTLAGQPISFTYKVSDGPVTSGGKESAPVTVTINVAEVNDDPVANDDPTPPAAPPIVIRNFTNQAIPSALANDNVGVDAGAVPGDVLSIASVSATTAAGNTVTVVGNNLFYNDNVGHVGLDTFQYTISDGRGGTDTATYTVNVVEFVPKDISGTVKLDGKPLAGVEIRLNGTNVLGTPSFAQVVVFTDENGNYSFDDLRPGNYTVTEITPQFIKDGAERTSHPSSLVTSIADDLYTLAWDTPLSITTGGVTGLDFNELRFDALQYDEFSLANLQLASSANGGLIFTVGPGNQVYWSYGPPGWQVVPSVQLVFTNNLLTGMNVTVNGVTKHVTHTGSDRFVIIGSTTAGEYTIGLIGTFSDFFAASITTVPESGPEGEAAPQMSDGEFRDSADQVFAEQAWA